MNNFIIVLFLFVLIIFSVLSSKLFSQWKNIIENYENRKTILFLGDSILQNEKYVKNGESVADNVRRISGNNVKNEAVDGAMMIDIQGQIKNIPEGLNNDTTYIFLSMGGNDILNNYVYNNNSTASIDKMLNSYKHAVELLKKKMDKSKIILLNIYVPKDEKLKKYQGKIGYWNSKLRENYSKMKDTYILDLNSIFSDKRDYTLEDTKMYFVEPSESGGKKLSAEIVRFTKQH